MHSSSVRGSRVSTRYTASGSSGCGCTPSRRPRTSVAHGCSTATRVPAATSRASSTPTASPKRSSRSGSGPRPCRPSRRSRPTVEGRAPRESASRCGRLNRLCARDFVQPRSTSPSVSVSPPRPGGTCPRPGTGTRLARIGASSGHASRPGTGTCLARTGCLSWRPLRGGAGDPRTRGPRRSRRGHRRAPGRGGAGSSSMRWSVHAALGEVVGADPLGALALRTWLSRQACAASWRTPPARRGAPGGRALSCRLDC